MLLDSAILTHMPDPKNAVKIQINLRAWVSKFEPYFAFLDNSIVVGLKYC